MRMRVVALLSVALASAASLAIANAMATQQPNSNQGQPEQAGGAEVLARGPVHEAYAEPSDMRPTPPSVVSKPPPAPIEEIPPDVKPAGDNVQWIAGYWGWDVDRNDYIWVSGFWRDAPPERQWVPGYWQEVDGGWQWSPGFWAAATLSDIEYVPPPPPPLDNGPSVAAPDANSLWVPGCWIYRDNRFAWRPGFYMAYQPNWTWMPASYIWSPAGYIFVDGYWDYPIFDRGLLFSPVRFAPGIRLGANFLFTPQYAVQPDFLLGALFVYPSACHYFFGDYFDNRYSRFGLVPWVDYRVDRFSYDPNYQYCRHHFAGDRNWDDRMRQLYAGRRQGTIPRPPHDLAQQRQAGEQRGTNVLQNLNLSHNQIMTGLVPVKQVNNLPVTALSTTAAARPGVQAAANVLHMEPVGQQQRNEARERAKQHQTIAQERARVEGKSLSEGRIPVRHTDQSHREHIDMPKPAGAATTRPPAGEPARPPATRPPEGERPRPQEGERPRPPEGERPRPPGTKPPENPPTRPPSGERPPANRPPETPQSRPPAGEPSRPPATRPPEAQPSRQPRPQPPPPPRVPPHEDRPIPQHEPPAAPRPPRGGGQERGKPPGEK